MVAEIILNSKVKNLNKTFDYIIPKKIEDILQIYSNTNIFKGGKFNGS